MKIAKERILDAYKFRYACKEFDANKKITEDEFQFILETGRLSPSSFGFEPWKFLVVQNEDLREKLKDASWGAQRQLPTASHFIVILARKALDTKAGSEYIMNMMREVQQLPEDIVELKGGFYSEFQKNDFDLTDERKLFDWASKQTYIPLGNMMTAAAMLEIDSCPIEGFNREKVDSILEKEGIVDATHYRAAVMVAFGYRAENAEVFPKTRRAMKEVVQWIK